MYDLFVNQQNTLSCNAQFKDLDVDSLHLHCGSVLHDYFSFVLLFAEITSASSSKV